MKGGINEDKKLICLIKGHDWRYWDLKIGWSYHRESKCLRCGEKVIYTTL